MVVSSVSAAGYETSGVNPTVGQTSSDRCADLRELEIKILARCNVASAVLTAASAACCCCVR